VENINAEISKDSLLAEFQGKQPVPFQLREIMEQRANAWVMRLYDACCDAYKTGGKTLSAEFDRAVWFYRVEPFIMGETDSQIHSGTMGGFLNLLLCAVGSTPEKRPSLTVSQKQCCFDVRMKVYETWYDKLHHLPSRINEAIEALAQANARERRASRIVARLTPDDCPPPPTTPVHRLTHPEESPSQRAFSSDPETPPSSTKKKFPSPLPSATIVGANINEFVAWDGEQYVLRPTKESVLADEGLKLIGSVRELSRVRRFSAGYVFVQNPSQESPRPDCTLLQDPQKQPPTEAPSLAQPFAPMPPHVSPASSAPPAGATEPATPVRSSALEPASPPLRPAQEGPEEADECYRDFATATYLFQSCGALGKA
jgi:hypothetical protein